MTLNQALDEMLSEEMPCKDEIKVGDTLSFRVGNRMVPFQVTGLGFHRMQITSLDLTMKGEIQKTKWMQQKELLASLNQPQG